MHTQPPCATYSNVSSNKDSPSYISSNKDSPSYIILKYRYFWLKFIATLHSALLVHPPCCLLAHVLWRRKRRSSRNNISLATLLSGGFSRACADLTTSLGADILGQDSREASTRLYLRKRVETPLMPQVIYLRESNKNHQIKWLKHESGKSYSATR